MRARSLPTDAPTPEDIAAVFEVYHTEVADGGDRLLYYGDFRVPVPAARQRLAPVFRAAGYDLTVTTRAGEHVIVAEAQSGGFPILNIVLFLLTVVSTLFVGAVGWYFVDPSKIASQPTAVLRAWPFTAAVLGVLGVHELGHYAMSRYHDVSATLPYFIPVPTIIGTMGAVIKLRGQMPDRKALFDIGVAGPIAGLVATVIVTAIGLSLPPVEVPASVLEQEGVRLVNPPLLEAISALVGQPATYDAPALVANPVVVGGWVGMFVTFLNLIPVGQLDGGHMLRAMLGRRQETLSAFVPMGLFALAGYLYYIQGRPLEESVLLWVVWGGFSILLAANGAAHPLSEERLGWRRQLVGVLTFAVGLLCFTPVPFELVP
jgi:membrane-associated protease RseP (regulator of RpoE activity)